MGNILSTIGSSSQTTTRPAEENRVPVKAPPREVEKASKPSAEQVQNAIRESGERVSFSNREIEFSYNEDLDRVIVKVLSSDSPPKVVRQIPAEEFLNFATRFRELLGVLFDEQA